MKERYARYTLNKFETLIRDIVRVPSYKLIDIFFGNDVLSIQECL